MCQNENFEDGRIGNFACFLWIEFGRGSQIFYERSSIDNRTETKDPLFCGGLDQMDGEKNLEENLEKTLLTLKW